MATMKQKTVWIAADGSEHATEHEADNWDRYTAIRDILEDADLDWRDGVSPGVIAELLSARFKFVALT